MDLGLRHLLLSFFLMIATTVVWAQSEGENTLNVRLQALSHGELRHGGLDDTHTENNDETDHAYFLMGRSRLIVNYSRPHLETKITAQHSGIWGQKGQGSFNLNEAWFKLYTSWGLFAQIGRQALSYDDERIIGPNDWAMASLSHDVIRAGYEGYGHKAHIILGFNQNAENTYGGTYYSDGAQPYKNLLTLWYHYDVPIWPVGISALLMNIGMQGGIEGGTHDDVPENRYQQLFGSYLTFHPNRFSAEASFYRQVGHNENNAVLNSWMASVKMQYEATRWAQAIAGYDHLSGDDYFAVPRAGQLGVVRHSVLKGFSSVYGSHHKFYGLMDFFYVKTYLNGFSPGLQNLFAGCSIKPWKNLDIKLMYHYLAMSTHLKGMDLTLGHDIDIEASYQIMRDVRLSVGFSYMDGTKTMEQLKRASDKDALQWAWFSLSVSPTLFTTRW